jgi:ABC-type lipoprotein release transport system permease subunit
MQDFVIIVGLNNKVLHITYPTTGAAKLDPVEAIRSE